MDPSLSVLKRVLQVIKSLKRDNIYCRPIYALTKNTRAEL